MRIVTVSMGINTSYLIVSDGVIAVDAGIPGTSMCLIRGMEKAHIPSNDLRLIVATHGHIDHVGCIGKIKRLTGAGIALHQREVPWLEQARMHSPPGITRWGRVLAKMMGTLAPLVGFPTAKVDVALSDDEFSLHDYGIPGRVLHTPGHTSGSVSVLLDGGEAFVGDLAMGAFPLLRFSPGLTIFGEDEDQVRQSLRLLLDCGARTIYPAHGGPFSADVVRDVLGL